MKIAPPIGVVCFYLGICLVMGGASNAGHLANLVLQILGVLLLCGLLLVRGRSQALSTSREVWTIAILIALLAALQFLPLPSFLWSDLPGRADIAEELMLLGEPPRILTLTLAPQDSLASLSWAAPSLLLLFSLLMLNTGWQSALAKVIAFGTLAALIVGLVQIFSGKESDLYLYDFTNRSSLVGFFANANHMASLLLVSLPFFAALVCEQRYQRSKFSNEFAILGALAATSVFIGVALVGSLTGYALAIPVLLASCAIVFPEIRRLTAIVITPAVIAGAALISLNSETENVFGGEEFASSTSREVLNATTFRAAVDFFPVGSGLGTFQEIYSRYESAEAVDRTYANHAHNDYLEIILELGLPGLLLLVGFLVWWALQARSVWLSEQNDPFSKAAIVASGTLLLHSAWDYPLRTAALSCVFAYCIAILLLRHASPTFHSDSKIHFHRSR